MVSTNLLPSRPCWRGRKGSAVLRPCSFSPPFYLNASGLTAIRPHQTLQLLGLEFFLETERKTQFPKKGMVHFFFFSFVIYYLRQGRKKARCEGVREWKTLSKVYLAVLSELFTFSSSFWRRLRVYCMSLHMTAVKKYVKFGFHSSSLLLHWFAL